MEGLFLLNKPTNITSAAFLNKFKKIIEEKTGEKDKTGHGGTLDKFAEGLLIVGVSRHFTRLLPLFLKNSKKEYEAEIEFGKTTDTLDPEGKLLTASKKIPSKKEIIETLKSFPLNSPFPQIAPLFSAKKISGRRSSDLARQNIKPEAKKSEVILYDFSVINYSPPILKIHLLVSSGFYIRSFAHDLAEKSNSSAFVKYLTRTKIIANEKTYSLKNTLSLENLENSITLTGTIFGLVQGVGFRAFLRQKMSELNLVGTAANLPDDFLEFSATGLLSALSNLETQAKLGPPSVKVSNSFFLFSKNTKHLNKKRLS